MQMLHEKAFLDKLSSMTSDELDSLDITMSGTCATLMIQTPKKVYLSWVGDCHAVLCKKEKKSAAIRLTTEHGAHNPTTP